MKIGAVIRQFKITASRVREIYILTDNKQVRDVLEFAVHELGRLEWYINENGSYQKNLKKAYQVAQQGRDMWQQIATNAMWREKKSYDELIELRTKYRELEFRMKGLEK